MRRRGSEWAPPRAKVEESEPVVIVIHPTARVSALADIENSVRGTVITIGPYAVVDAFVKIKPAGGTGDVTIGSHSTINSGVTIFTGNGVVIGDDVLIGANVVLGATSHNYADRNALIREQGFVESKGGILIEDDSWVGPNSTVLDGAVVSRGCVVSAGSIVMTQLKPYCVYAGNPLRLIGERG